MSCCCDSQGGGGGRWVSKLCVRLSHTALVLGVPVSLLFKDTALSDAFLRGEGLTFGLLYAALLVVSLATYFLACCSDPGYLPLRSPGKQRGARVAEREGEERSGWDSDHSDHGDHGDHGDEGAAMLQLDTTDPDLELRLCDHCHVQQPMRSKHCEDCGRCVRRYDHHCPWLEACVGERNHRYFWTFLLATSVLICVTLLVTWRGIAYRPLWGDWLRGNAVLMVDTAVLATGGCVTLGLLAFHTFLMLTGATTWETAARRRISYLRRLRPDLNPFHEGVLGNLRSFLCRSRRCRPWEGVYARRTLLSRDDSHA